jgi:hypothetical protein
MVLILLKNPCLRRRDLKTRGHRTQRRDGLSFVLGFISSFFSFRFAFSRFFPACTHYSCLQPVCDAGSRLAPGAFISQIIRLIQRLALQAAPMK